MLRSGSILSALDSLVEDAFFDEVETPDHNVSETGTIVTEEPINTIKHEYLEDMDEGGTLHLCDHCTFQTEDLEDFMDHVQNNIPHSLKCLQCTKIFFSDKELKKHCTNTHRNRMKLYVSCETCRYKALSKESLQQHKFATHVNSVYSCNTCGYYYQSSEGFLEHLVTHPNLEELETGQKIQKKEREYA